MYAIFLKKLRDKGIPGLNEIETKQSNCMKNV